MNELCYSILVSDLIFKFCLQTELDQRHKDLQAIKHDVRKKRIYVATKEMHQVHTVDQSEGVRTLSLPPLVQQYQAL